MANSEAVSGVHSYALYGKETTYNTAVARTLHLGLVKSAKPDIQNNLTENRGFVGTTTGGRTVFKHTAGALTLGIPVEFTVTDWAFLEFVLGTVAGGPTYTFTKAALPPSMTISTNIDNPGSASTDQELTLSGAVVDKCTIKCSVGEPVSASIDLKAALVVVDTSLSAAVALPANTVFNFSGATIELPDGTLLTNIIDSVEISISNNYEMLYGLSSRLARNALPKELGYEVKISVKYIDNDLVTAALGATTPTATGSPTENATLAVKFDDGAGRSADFVFTGVPMSAFAQMHELNTAVGEDITLPARELTVTFDSA